MSSPSSNGFMVEGNISGAILKLAWPTMLSMIVQSLFNLVDAFWVGKLGADALAAVAGATFFLWAAHSIAQVSATGLTSLVSQYWGAGNQSMARTIAAQGTLFATATGTITGIAGILFLPLLFRIMSLPMAVQELAKGYLTIYMGGIFLLFIFIALEAVFRAAGDTLTPMKILGGGLLINVLLDPICIFGIGIIKPLGVRGAALATILSVFLATVYTIYTLIKKGLLPSKRELVPLNIRWKDIGKIIWIGAPIALNGVIFSFVYILLTRILSRFGSEPLAALGMGHRIENIAYMSCVGFATAAATMVGQNIGARRIDRAARSAWLATWYGSMAMGLFSLIAVLWGKSIIQLFIQDTLVVTIGQQYLYIICLCEVFLAFEIVLEGGFSGAGHTIPPMSILLPITALRVPLAYVFAIHFNHGPIAVWWVISLTTLVKGMAMAFWFSLGTWNKGVIGDKHSP